MDFNVELSLSSYTAIPIYIGPISFVTVMLVLVLGIGYVFEVGFIPIVDI